MTSWEAVVVIAIALAVGLTFLEIFLTRRRARAKAKREASTQFRSAFLAESTAHLENKDVYRLITEAQAKHDAAIMEFRPFVEPKQIKHFDTAEQNFRRYRSELQPRILKTLAAIDSNKLIDNSDIVRLKEALNELLAFADKT